MKLSLRRALDLFDDVEKGISLGVEIILGFLSQETNIFLH
jgi:hypothetical protein